jgi:hypothetical protein
MRIWRSLRRRTTFSRAGVRITSKSKRYDWEPQGDTL